MQINDSTRFNASPTDDSLETADAVARAAHLWIRSLCLNEFHSEDERCAIAAGLVAGLCERLALNARIKELVAYVYTLLDNEGNQALAISRLMLDQPIPQSKRRAYDIGKTEAAGIVEMLGYHDLYKPHSERSNRNDY
jgi:hypothetical protein